MSNGFWTGRRVLLTGHTGFKGSWLAAWLDMLGAKVTGFALPPDTTPSLFADMAPSLSLDSRIGDIRDPDAIGAALADATPQVIFHLAAQALVRPSYRQPVDTFATNVMGTVHLLDAVRRVPGVQAVVVVTSDKCYENREWLWPYREDEPMGGWDPYSASKGCAELVTASYRRSFFSGDDAPGIASARAGNVIGGGDWSEDRLVPDIIRACYAGTPTPIRNPDAIRPWQHVLEPLGGYLQLAERLCAAPRDYDEAWNFGPDECDTRTVGQVADALAACWPGAPGWTATGGPQPHEATFLKVDSSKARARLDWAPRLSATEALAWTADWYRQYRKGAEAATLTRDQIRAYQERERKENPAC